MHKMRLHELCRSRRWEPPEYTVNREGPDHAPRFCATVAVAGATFDAPDPSGSSKEAQNKAAMAALDHLTSAADTIPPSPQTPENQISFKSQLQIYVQKRNKELPIYNSTNFFMATVTVDGQTFESPKYFSTIEEAESAAAEVALMALPQEENQQETFSAESALYKNLLQELTQREGISLPSYQTERDGACHMPTFRSTVEVESESFEGDVAKTKKQAEMNAAKVAWYKLRERKQNRLVSDPLTNSCMQKEFDSAHPSTAALISSDENEAVAENHTSNSLDSIDSQLDQKPKPPILLANALEDYTAAPPTMRGAETTVKNENTEEHNLPQDLDSLSSTSSDLSDDPITTVSIEYSKGRSYDSLMCNRVRVFPRKPDLVLPQGATLLPFSDDMWVAVSLNFRQGDVLI
ncbi:double-stranded RNA-binding protein 1-like isoform X1 [Ananas comosus]|uniref:Double-stranded RNA-binding protein 1-like isoform X1 n=1 Tax=Ananas comosus TaxID=4615 RepID=A0A6P5EUG0_ANACO|nr:double-stranded RNA-binding protein 1-like isoform X1 [Ananas comosus]